MRRLRVLLFSSTVTLSKKVDKHFTNYYSKVDNMLKPVTCKLLHSTQSLILFNIKILADQCIWSTQYVYLFLYWLWQPCEHTYHVKWVWREQLNIFWSCCHHYVTYRILSQDTPSATEEAHIHKQWMTLLALLHSGKCIKISCNPHTKLYLWWLLKPSSAPYLVSHLATGTYE